MLTQVDAHSVDSSRWLSRRSRRCSAWTTSSQNWCRASQKKRWQSLDKWWNNVKMRHENFAGESNWFRYLVEFDNIRLCLYSGVLWLDETERLVQELTKCHIDTYLIIVNQVLFSSLNGAPGGCRRCTSRMRLQQKYIEQECIRFFFFIFLFSFSFDRWSVWRFQRGETTSSRRWSVRCIEYQFFLATSVVTIQTMRVHSACYFDFEQKSKTRRAFDVIHSFRCERR